VVVGAWIYAGIRLTPLYLEYMRVASTLEKVRDEFDSNPGTTEFMLRKAVERHFDIEMVEVITSNDIEITREGGEFTMRATYEATTPDHQQHLLPRGLRQVGHRHRALSGR
jgi:hypothetical protein